MVNDRIKVMLAIDGLGLGGAEMVVRDLARGLDSRKFDVCICCTKGIGGEIGKELLRDGFDIFVLPGKDNDKVDYLTPLKFRKAAKERNIDVVHTHATPALLDAACSRLLMPRLKVVHTFHYGNYPYDSWRHHMMEGVLARAVNKLIAVGIEQRNRIMETYKLSQSRIDAIWNGVTIAPHTKNESFRTQFNTGNLLLVGTIAKLIEQKGLDDLLKVAQHCKVSGLPMQFVIVGEGPLRSELEQRRSELGLEDTVIITGWLKNAAARVLPEFDVFFQPSRWEAMSIAILEAMANGKAIVATRVGDNPHVLEDNVSGILVNSGDINGMANALSRVADSELRTRLGNAAKKRFEQKFTLQHMIQAYERVYLDLVGVPD